MLVARMDADSRRAALPGERLFQGTGGAGIGVSYLRVSIGSSDLDERVFSYDDLPPGRTDPGMSKFSLAQDRRDLIPGSWKDVLKVALDLKIAGGRRGRRRAWMKSNNKSVGGRLRPEFYGAYAKYFVKYIQGMKAEGIRIVAVTVLSRTNLLNPGNNPSFC